jgi:hypothetical protein
MFIDYEQMSGIPFLISSYYNHITNSGIIEHIFSNRTEYYYNNNYMGTSYNN